MIYYKITPEFNQKRINNITFIENELFTLNELKKNKINTQIIKKLKKIEINKNNTYFSFGARFEK